MVATIDRSADLIRAGVNGGGWVAPENTAQPATPDFSQPASPWSPLGAISTDGLTEGFSQDQTEVLAWGQLTPIRVLATKKARTFKVKMIETSRDAVRSVFFGVAASTLTPDASGNSSISESGTPARDLRAWLFDVIDGADVERIYVPSGEVTDRADVQHHNNDVDGYEVTVTAYPDADGNVAYRLYTGQAAAS